MAALQREKEQQQRTLRQEVETALDLDEVLRDLAFISGMMEEDEEEEDDDDDEDARERGANGNEVDKGSLQEEYISLRQAYRQMDEERTKQQQQQPESTGVVSSMENEEVISLKRPEPSQSVDEMLGVREIDRNSNVSI